MSLGIELLCSAPSVAVWVWGSRAAVAAGVMEMGTMATASCDCGYATNVMLGGGIVNFKTLCLFPVLSRCGSSRRRGPSGAKNCPEMIRPSDDCNRAIRIRSAAGG